LNNKYQYIIVLTMAMILISIPVAAENVDLVINGQQVNQDLMVIDGRTLVPAEILSTYFGETVIWDRYKDELRINRNKFKVRLPLNERVAFVNTEVIPLSIKTRLVNDKVMIPLRLLPKIYGGKLAWQASDKTIYYSSNQIEDMNINESKNKLQVIIKTDSLPDSELQLYHQPQRLVLDLKNINIGDAKDIIPLNKNIVKKIRVSQYQVNPASVRIVADINQMSSYYLKKEDSKLILEVKSKNKIVTSSITSDYNLKVPDSSSNNNLNQKRIVIDPGHGGQDPGAIGVSGVDESKVVYQIAKKVNQLLKQENFKTLMTRGQNEFISLSGRAEMANRWPADLFISIHANSNNLSTIGGTATYAHWSASKKNWALAWYVQSEIMKRIQIEDNGLKAANFAVLRETKMPALLIETAFLSNLHEEYLLNTHDFQQQVAEGIVAGIKEYFNNENN